MPSIDHAPKYSFDLRNDKKSIIAWNSARRALRPTTVTISNRRGSGDQGEPPAAEDDGDKWGRL